VLGTGGVVSNLRGLVKDVSGYDLASLLCGSEGTLGVVTAARLALVAPMPERTTALLAFASAASAVEAAGTLRRSVPALAALELVLDDGVALVCDAFGLAPPFPRAHRAYLLVEAADVTDPTEQLAGAVGSLTSVADVAVAGTGERRDVLWRYRDAHSEAIATVGVAHKLDVSLPLAALADYLDAVPAVVAAVAPGARTWLFGHVGDANVHVNVTGVDPDDDAVDEAVLALALDMGGGISAEHGIGVAKRRFLDRYRSPAELDAFRALRSALDPAGILNPNVLLPPD
jgi:FAD/FMN-containing dehydrogenase